MTGSSEPFSDTEFIHNPFPGPNGWLPRSGNSLATMTIKVPGFENGTYERVSVASFLTLHTSTSTVAPYQGMKLDRCLDDTQLMVHGPGQPIGVLHTQRGGSKSDAHPGITVVANLLLDGQ